MITATRTEGSLYLLRGMYTSLAENVEQLGQLAVEVPDYRQLPAGRHLQIGHRRLVRDSRSGGQEHRRRVHHTWRQWKRQWESSGKAVGRQWEGSGEGSLAVAKAVEEQWEDSGKAMGRYLKGNYTAAERDTAVELR